MRNNIISLIFLLISFSGFAEQNEAWNGFYFGMSQEEAKVKIEENLKPYDKFKIDKIYLNKYSNEERIFEIFDDVDCIKTDDNKYKKLKFENYYTNSAKCTFIEFNSKQVQYDQNEYLRNIKIYFDNNKLIGIVVRYGANNDVILSKMEETFGKAHNISSILQLIWSDNKYHESSYNQYKWNLGQKLLIFKKYRNENSSEYWAIDNDYVILKKNERENIINAEKLKKEEEQKNLENKKNEGIKF